MPAQPRLDEITSALHTLTETLGRADDVEEVLRAICEQVTMLVPGADLASVTLDRKGDPSTAASTDERATALERSQYEAGDGPCLTAARERTPLRGEAATSGARWPEFTRTAKETGVASYLAAPLDVDDEVTGALNLFGLTEHGFHSVDMRVLELYTTVASAIVRSTSRYQRSAEVIDQLDRALTTRAVIEQAKGILMATHHITETEAFQLLVDRSQQENTKLHLVAERFVHNVSTPKAKS